MDGNVLVSMKASTLNARHYKIEDLKPGDVVSGVVGRLNPAKQMVVLLSEKVRAICTSMHFSDIELSNPERLFKTNQQVKCRVLEVDAKRKRARDLEKNLL